MKKIMLLFALLVGLSAFAQNFPGEKVELLSGKTLTVLPLEQNLQEFGYKGFFTDADLKNIYKNEGTSTSYKALAGKVFKVVSYEPYINSSKELKYKLLIENSETGKLYFDYDSEYSFSFPFEVVGGLTYPKDFFCNKITEKEMGDPNNTWYQAPVADGVQVFNSVGKTQLIYMTINVPTNEKYVPNVIKRGAVLTFDNGKTIVLPDEKIKTEKSPVSNNAVFKAIIHISQENYELVKAHKLVAVKLDKYENQHNSGYAIREYLKCFLKN